MVKIKEKTMLFKLPDCYKRAAWGGTTRFDRGASRIGVTFEVGEGEVVHVSLDEASARYVAETLQDSLPIYVRERRQSEISSGSASGVNVKSAEDFAKYLQSQWLLVAKEEKGFSRQRWYRVYRRILLRLRSLLQHRRPRW